MPGRTLRNWDAAESFAADLERDGHRILAMSEERSGVRVTWAVGEQMAMTAETCRFCGREFKAPAGQDPIKPHWEATQDDPGGCGARALADGDD